MWISRKLWFSKYFVCSPELRVAWHRIRADVNLKLSGERTTKCSKQNQFTIDRQSATLNMCSRCKWCRSSQGQSNPSKLDNRSKQYQCLIMPRSNRIWILGEKKPGRVSSWLECWLDLEEALWSLPLPGGWEMGRRLDQTVFHRTFRPWCDWTQVKELVAPRLSESGCSLRPSWGEQPFVPSRPHCPPQPFGKYSLHAF